MARHRRAAPRRAAPRFLPARPRSLLRAAVDRRPPGRGIA